MIEIGILGGLAACALSASIVVLRRGRYYGALRPQSRPRRWVLFSMLLLIAVFIVWFPVWFFWPGALIARILTGLFGIVFAVVCLALRWFSPLIDRFIERKGWSLR